MVDLLLPRSCAVCERLDGRGRHGARLRTLLGARTRASASACDRCGHPQSRPTCGWCEQLPPFVRAARSAYWIPGGTAGAIVHALKYGGWAGVAEGMAERMARLAWPRDVVAERTVVVPMPLAPTASASAASIRARCWAARWRRRWKIPFVSECVVRARATETQTRLTPEERRSNVSGAFRASETRGSAFGALTSCSWMTSSPPARHFPNARRRCSRAARESSVS